MANARVIDVQHTVQGTATPPKPKAKARPASKKFDYAIARQRFNRHEDFWAFLADYPDKRGLSCYVYRLDPVINMARVGQDASYIDVIADLGLMSYNAIAEAHGGGKYQVMLSDANRSGGSEAARSFMTVPVEEREPKLDVRTVVLDDKKNAQYVEKLIVRGVVVRDSTGAPQLKTETTVSDLLSEMKKAAGVPALAAPAPVGNDVLGQVVVELLRQRGGGVTADPGKQIQDALSLADRLHPPTNPVMDGLLLKLVDRMTAPPAAVAIPDPLESFDRWEKIFARIGNGAAAVTSGPGIVSQIFTGLGEVVKNAPQLVAAFQMLQRSGAPSGAVIPISGVPSGLDAGAGRPLQIDPDSITELNCFSLIGDPAVQARLKHVAGKAAEVMDRGVKGWDYAVSLCAMELDGRALFRLLELMGVSAIMGALGQVPEVPQRAAADPAYMAKLEAWVEDFLGFDSKATGEEPIIEGGMSASEEPAPAAA